MSRLISERPKVWYGFAEDSDDAEGDLAEADILADGILSAEDALR